MISKMSSKMSSKILKIKTLDEEGNNGNILIDLNSKWLLNDRARMFKYFIGLESGFKKPNVNGNNELTLLEDNKITKSEFLLFLTFMRCGPAMFESIELSEEIMESLLMTTNQLGGCDELDDYINEIALKKISDKKKDEERKELMEHNPLCPEDNYHDEYTFKLTGLNHVPDGDEWQVTKPHNHLVWIRKKIEKSL